MAQTLPGTLALLEQRLHRIEFLLLPGEKKIEKRLPGNGTVNSRLAEVEQKLSQLESKSRPIYEILDLYSKHPELFEAPDDYSKDDEIPRTVKTSIVLSHEESFRNTVSNLNAINDLEIPELRALIPLLLLQDRLAKAQVRQEMQTRAVTELRERSADLIARWYHRSILDDGETWLDLERRMMKIEQTVTRQETARAREANAV